MNKVIYDLLYCQPLHGIKYHGGGEYIKSVFARLIEECGSSCSIEVCYNPNLFLDDWIVDVINQKGIVPHYVKNESDISKVLFQYEKEGNVSFFTGMIYPYDSTDLPRNIRKIGVCHGIRAMEIEKDKEAWRYRKAKDNLRELLWNTIGKKTRHKQIYNSFSRIFSKFDIIVTDSNHSAYSIKNHFFSDIANKELKVFYAPIKVSNANLSLFPEENNSIVMISANRWLKNSYRGVKAIDELYEKGLLKGIVTKVYGGYPTSLQKKIRNRKYFQFFDYVSPEELEAAYYSCRLFFYPSLNEGFGLPPLEAMKYGKTCVISSVCSLPEVYQNAVYYINPYDVGEMQARVLEAVEKPISINIINDRVKQIYEKQEHDVRELCKLILE